MKNSFVSSRQLTFKVLLVNTKLKDVKLSVRFVVKKLLELCINKYPAAYFSNKNSLK